MSLILVDCDEAEQGCHDVSIWNTNLDSPIIEGRLNTKTLGSVSTIAEDTL